MSSNRRGEISLIEACLVARRSRCTQKCFEIQAF